MRKTKTPRSDFSVSAFQFSAFNVRRLSISAFQLLTPAPSDFSVSAFQRFSFLKKMRLSEELRARCKSFASEVIRLYSVLPKQRDEVRVIGRQLLRSGTSVAAHAREASRARSEAEFCSKLDGLLQEADESQLWLELLRDDCAIADARLATLHQEAGELLAIFTSIVSQLRKRNA